MKTVNTALVIGLLSGFLISANAQTNQSMNDSFYNDFVNMQKNMEKMFQDFHQKYFKDDKFFNNSSILPKSNFKDAGSTYVLKMKLPGFDKSNIHIKTKDNMLYVDAKTYNKNEKKSNNTYQSSVYADSFYRSFLLPNNAKTQDMKTDYKNGVLTIKIPKS
ncbi:MAG: Hsp20/alpha crystallin family protein [Sulfurospirillaceae bacterium]|nr:Hsp20/alpha crystallin family protein [Sulfurospirillaceae bacterium]